GHVVGVADARVVGTPLGTRDDRRLPHRGGGLDAEGRLLVRHRRRALRCGGRAGGRLLVGQGGGGLGGQRLRVRGDRGGGGVGDGLLPARPLGGEVEADVRGQAAGVPGDLHLDRLGAGRGVRLGAADRAGLLRRSE